MPVMGGDVILIPEFLNRVIIMGGVRNPAAYDLKEEARLLDAIIAAGGPDDKAQLGQVAVTRQTGNTRVLVGTVDVNKIIKQGDQSQNILMQHGDVVYIPNNKVRWQDLLSYLGGVSLVRSIFGF
jgi:protein involved in polysaccharide export with SLBB domain